MQLVAGCLVLGVGAGLLLTVELGSDGFSTLIRGASLSAGVTFAIVNTVVSALFVAVAWSRGQTPGPGTLAQPVLVGLTVDRVLAYTSTPDALATRVVLLLVAAALMSLGVALYLGAGAGAGPVEGLAQAFDPPLPFALSYSLIQGAGAFIGWQLGASIGVGTILIVFGLGPIVDRLLPHLSSKALQDSAAG